MKDAQSASPLFLKLLAETAQIEWSELQRFFARGVLLKVARDIDLVSVAEAVASDGTKQVAEWLSAGLPNVSNPRRLRILLRAIPNCGLWWCRRGCVCRNGVEQRALIFPRTSATTSSC